MFLHDRRHQNIYFQRAAGGAAEEYKCQYCEFMDTITAVST